MSESQEIPTEQQDIEQQKKEQQKIDQQKKNLHDAFIKDFGDAAEANQKILDKLSNKSGNENEPEVEFDQQGRLISLKISDSD